MKVVLDTNVLVSGIFFSGPPAEILRAWSQGKFQLVRTPKVNPGKLSRQLVYSDVSLDSCPTCDRNFLNVSL